MIESLYMESLRNVPLSYLKGASLLDNSRQSVVNKQVMDRSSLRGSLGSTEFIYMSFITIVPAILSPMPLCSDVKKTIKYNVNHISIILPRARRNDFV